MTNGRVGQFQLQTADAHESISECQIVEPPSCQIPVQCESDIVPLNSSDSLACVSAIFALSGQENTAFEHSERCGHG